MGITPLLVSGPRGDYVLTMTGFCRDHWWATLLYINNLVHTDEICLGVTWYLSCDTQMFLVAPLVLYPMYRWSQKKHLGLIVWGVFMAVFTAVPVALSIKHDLPPSSGFMYIL